MNNDVTILFKVFFSIRKLGINGKTHKYTFIVTALSKSFSDLVYF